MFLGFVTYVASDIRDRQVYDLGVASRDCSHNGKKARRRNDGLKLSHDYFLRRACELGVIEGVDERSSCSHALPYRRGLC